MNAADDDDVKLQRSSAALLADISKLLPILLRKKTKGSHYELRQRVKERDMYTLIVMVDKVSLPTLL